MPTIVSCPPPQAPPGAHVPMYSSSVVKLPVRSIESGARLLFVEKLRTQGAAVAIAATTEANIDPQGKPGGNYTRIYSETLTTADFADIVVTVNWTDDGVAHTLTVRDRRSR